MLLPVLFLFPNPDEAKLRRNSTKTLDCFTYLGTSFYPKGKKIVPINIKDLLEPRGLAAWFGDDGNKR